MEYFDNVESESEGRDVSELNLVLLTPASSRAASPNGQDLILMNQDPFIEPTVYPLVDSITPISRLGNDLEIIKLIDRGQFGHVIEVRHQIDMQFYAVKCIPLTSATKENRITIMQEAKTLAELKNENLMSYCDSWIDNCPYDKILSWGGNDNIISGNSQTSVLCILTELCATNLTHLIDSDLYKEPSRARNIFWKIAEGLAYLHEKGFIHGDLRPHNILIKKMDANKKSNCGVCLQMCYSSAQLPCRHICCSLCVKEISIETRDCAICQMKIPFGYFNRPLDEAETEKQKVPIVQWMYQGTKRWWPYDENNNVVLENEFNAGNLECTLVVQSTKYRINFPYMVQMQESDRTKSRKIKREPPPLTIKEDDVDDVKIGDFGLTRLASDFIGFVTQKDDMYSLGVILLEMFLYSVIDKDLCSGWTVRQKMEAVLRNKDPKNVALVYILRRLLNETSSSRPTCAELLGPIKRGFEQLMRGKKRQAEQLQEENTKRMRETQLR